MIKKLLIALGFIAATSTFSSAAAPVRYVQISTNSISTQTGGYNVSSGTVTGQFSVGGEFKPGLTSSTSGQFLLSQGAAAAPKFQFNGRINGPDNYTITAATSTTATGTLGANTSLSGTHTTLTAGEKVLVLISGTCQVAASDGGSIGLKRDTTNIGGSGGCTRVVNNAAAALQLPCSCVLQDTPGSVGTFTYTVTFNSSAGGTFQFGETNRTSTLEIIGYPK